MIGRCKDCKHLATTWTFAGVVSRCKKTGSETTPARGCDEWESKIDKIDAKICNLCGAPLEEWCYWGVTDGNIGAVTCTDRCCVKWLIAKKKMRVK